MVYDEKPVCYITLSRPVKILKNLSQKKSERSVLIIRNC